MLLSSLLDQSLAVPMCNVTPQTYEFSRKSKRYLLFFIHDFLDLNDSLSILIANSGSLSVKVFHTFISGFALE